MSRPTHVKAKQLFLKETYLNFSSEIHSLPKISFSLPMDSYFPKLHLISTPSEITMRQR